MSLISLKSSKGKVKHIEMISRLTELLVLALLKSQNPGKHKGAQSWTPLCLPGLSLGKHPVRSIVY